jgi:flagellar hook assembly protein FlgD
MRIKLAVLTGFLLAGLGATCAPLIDNTVRTPETGTVLSIVLSDPSVDANIAAGATVKINWAVGNVSGDAATVKLLAESRVDLSRTTLIDGVHVAGTGGPGEFDWNTTGFVGQYSIIGQVAAGDRSVEKTAAGKVTVYPPMTFAFTAPTSNVDFKLGQTPAQTVTVSWTGSGLNATAGVGLDVDQNHGGAATDPNDLARNEIFIARADLTTTPASGTFSFTGNDKDGNSVPPGTYYLFAIAADGVNTDLAVDANVTVIVRTADPNEPATSFLVTKPATDQSFIDANSPVTLEYKVKQAASVLIDLKMDTDDNHTNGNERTIDAQRLVDPNSPDISIQWVGLDATGAAVPDGIYRVFGVMNTGSGTPTTADAAGLVFRRSRADQPLIGLLQPATTTSVDLGSFVSIQWRDDDPNTGATIRLTVDDDPNPAEAVETGNAEVEILSGRAASGDAVQDTFAWQVPSSFVPGTYYVFAYIDHDGTPPADNVSVAPGRIVVKDPTKP